MRRVSIALIAAALVAAGCASAPSTDSRAPAASAPPAGRASTPAAGAPATPSPAGELSPPIRQVLPNGLRLIIQESVQDRRNDTQLMVTFGHTKFSSGSGAGAPFRLAS